MHAKPKLTTDLAAVSLVTVSGPWMRCVAHEYLGHAPPGAAPGSKPDPLWPGASKKHGQRFTPKGSFDTLYLTDSADTALLEVGAVFRKGGKLIPTRADPQVLVTIHGTVLDVLDTTDPSVQSALGTTTAELTGVWAYVRGRGLAPTQELGQAAYDGKRIHAILYTSAKNPPATCLCVFPDRLDPKHEMLRVIDTSGNLVSTLP